MGFKLSANNVKDCADEKLGIIEFAGMTYTSRQHKSNSPYHNMNNKDYHHHKKKITNICHTRRNCKSEVRFNHITTLFGNTCSYQNKVSPIYINT